MSQLAEKDWKFFTTWASYSKQSMLKKSPMYTNLGVGGC